MIWLDSSFDYGENKFLFVKIGATVSFIGFWDFLIFYQIFLSPQVKRCAIIPYINDIYKLPHELSNNLRLRILGD